MFKCTCGFHTCEGSYETETDRTNHLKAVKAEKTKDEIKKVKPYHIAGMSQSKIESKTGYSAETVSRCIRKIDNLKRKKSRKKECLECFENGKSEHEAASITSLTPAKVKKYYNKFKKEQGLDILPPQSSSTSPKSSDKILSINGETSFQIKCNSCGEMKNGKIFLVDHSRTSESGILQSGFNLDADRCDKCNEKVDVKFISDDMAS